MIEFINSPVPAYTGLLFLGAGAAAALKVKGWFGNGNGHGNCVSRKEFLTTMENFRKEEKADRQIIFSKLDTLADKVEELGKEVCFLKGKYSSDTINHR